MKREVGREQMWREKVKKEAVKGGEKRRMCGKEACAGRRGVRRIAKRKV